MNNELRNKIYAFNKRRKEHDEKSSDLDVIISEVFKLPSGQLKKVLTDKVMTVLAKYGYS